MLLHDHCPETLMLVGIHGQTDWILLGFRFQGLGWEI